MTSKNGTIEFESRTELGKIIKLMDTYFSEHPEEKKDETLKEFYNTLDVMEMCW